LFVEHGHRLLGALAGIITIGLVTSTWFQEGRPWVRKLAFGALVLVIAQGALGGARVLFDEHLFAMIHGCVGPAYFAYCVTLAVITSRYWRDMPPYTDNSGAVKADRRLLRVSLLTAAFVYLQLVLGATIRHMAPDASPNYFRFAVFFHVGVAFVVLGHVLALAWRTWRQPLPALLRFPATAMSVLVLLQIALGITLWLLKYGWPFGLNDSYQFAATTIVSGSTWQAMITNAHVVMGAQILAFAVMCAVRNCRFFRSAKNLADQIGSPNYSAGWQWEAAT
jgi:cytochrome c oxidase assembly protein subunit 15